MSVILTILLSAAALLTASQLAAIFRARNKRRLLDRMQGIRSEAPGDIGISILCSGATDTHTIEHLLASEYARYEVIVVLDARRHPDLFAALTARYRMIRTAWQLTDELQVEGVRSLSRSRERRYRRLSVIDRAQGTANGDFDAAATVAAYDYLLPLRSGRRLAAGTLERLAAELGEEAGRTPELIRTAVGERMTLVARERIVEAGGFSGFSARRIPRKARRTLHEYLTLPADPQRTAPTGRMPRLLRIVAAVLLAGATIAAAATSEWTIAAALLTAALVWAAAGCASQLLRPREEY